MLPHVNTVSYKDHQLVVKSERNGGNLENILDFLRKEEIHYGKIYSVLPTLNDVFLEITGKELRD